MLRLDPKAQNGEIGVLFVLHFGIFWLLFFVHFEVSSAECPHHGRKLREGK
jgi:hypothetical protein